MRQPDPQLARCRGRTVEPRGQVVVGVALGQWRVQCRKAELRKSQHAGLQCEVQVAREHAQPRRACPDALGECSVVGAGDHQPRACKPFHGVEQLADRAVGNRLGVEHIARHQHGIDPVFNGQPGKGFDHRQARLRKWHGIIGRKLAVLASDLPVGGVEETGHGGIVAPAVTR